MEIQLVMRACVINDADQLMMQCSAVMMQPTIWTELVSGILDVRE